ncbi:MAG: SDR family oxidoreductase [Pseudomonadota bacterium]
MEKPVTLILGVGQTVGEAIALRCLEAGHAVIAVDPDEEQLAQISKAAGDKIETHHGDVHTKMGLKNALCLCSESQNRIDNVVVIPSLPEPDTLLNTETNHDADIDKSIKSALNTLRIIGSDMAERDGDVDTAGDKKRQAGTFTFVLSAASAGSQKGYFSEGVAQKAIRSIVQTASVELAQHHIRVNAISALRPRAERREPWLAKRTPIGRASTGEEIAETVLFLTNSASNIITGETIVLDGGRQNLSGIVDDD